MRSTQHRIAWPIVVCAGITACITEPSETVTALRFQEAEYTVIVGETRARPTAYFVNGFGYFPADTGTRMEIADTSVARLTNDGKIVAGSTPGSTRITAYNGAFSTSMVLHVSSNYFVWPEAMRLIPGAARKVVVHAEQLASGRALAQDSWESSNPSVATVAADGTITAIADGLAVITARRGEFSVGTQVLVASYSTPLVFMDFGLSPRGTCAQAASGIWCWGEHAGTTSFDRCPSLTFPQVSVTCSASPVHMSSMTFAELISVRGDSWAPLSAEPIGPYARTAEGKVYQLGREGPGEYLPAFTFRTFWPGRPSCAADLAGKGYCWNVNFDGYMGVGTAQAVGPWPQTPLGLSSDQKFVQFVRGESMCGLTEEGVAYCWGPNRNTGAGIGAVTPQAQGCYGPCVLVPFATATTARFTMLAGGGAGGQFGEGEVCGLTASRELYCWGPRLTTNGGPVHVTSRPGFVRIESGSSICGIEPSGDAYCSQASSSSTTPPYTFVKVPLPFPVTRIMMGDKISCALSATNGKLYCWGQGALGAGGTTTATAQNPVEVWGQR